LSEERAAPQPATGGLHLGEWAAELVGTALLVFAALSTVTLMFHPGSVFQDWIPSQSARLLLLGMVFAVVIIAIATSPIGRLSGAHLNPAVTLAFWITGHVHPHDLFGYWTAQLVGGALGAFALRLVWTQTAAGVEYGAITPEVSPWTAVLVEALMVGLLVGAMFLFLSARVLVRWTPVVAGAVVALDTWLGSAFTNTGLNPARTLGPNLVAAQCGAGGRGVADDAASDPHREALPRLRLPLGPPHPSAGPPSRHGEAAWGLAASGARAALRRAVRLSAAVARWPR
jgi:aquaporin Z